MRTKIYIAFDGDSDLMSYRTIQSWSANQALSFNLNDAHDVNYARDDSLPQSIINQLREHVHGDLPHVLTGYRDGCEWRIDQGCGGDIIETCQSDIVWDTQTNLFNGAHGSHGQQIGNAENSGRGMVE